MEGTHNPAQPSWTVITVAYNSAGMLRRCWSTGPKPYTWLVVDNHSSDDSAQVAEELGATVLRLPENVGFAAANNAALRQAQTPLVLFANPDLVVEPEGLHRLQAHLETHGGLVAPQLMYPDGTPQPNGRGLPYLTARLGNRRVWPFSRLHSSYRMFAGPGQGLWAAWITGAALAARRCDVVELGGWDERFFLYYEDIELCLRAWRHGRCVAVLGDVRWAHHWQRANNTLRWNRTHTLEVKAARTFYRMHPEFILGVPRPRRRHARAAARTGHPVTEAPTGVPA